MVDFPAWTVAPFVLLLLSIALLPLAAEHFWHRNKNKALVVALLTGPLLLYFAYLQFVRRQPAFGLLAEELVKYAFFMILLGSLYTVAGGIVVETALEPRPFVNTAFLALGACLANVIGTTGASVLLIRPLLRMNHSRRHAGHVPLFFIFTVGNVGGLLTPLGDPPLFLGFLNGVPFTWTLRLWPQWLFVNGTVLAVFSVWDWLAFRREEKRTHPEQHPPLSPLRLRGWLNVLFMGGIVAGVLLQGILPEPHGEWIGSLVMLAMALLSLAFTPDALRKRNVFSWEPIAEVAILFLGIFATMTPALALLTGPRQHAGPTQPWQFFWLTGLLSSFLDNAPTYLTFATMAAGSHDLAHLANNQINGMAGSLVLQAISCGAVFMGALTYIGNGPNFMVKAIAEHGGYKMPSFFGYLLYSSLVLVPIFLAATWLFFVRS